MTTSNKATVIATKPVTTLNAVASSSRGDIYKISIDDIHVEENFNLRDFDSPEIEAHIESICSSIMAGETIPPLSVRMVAGQVIVDDGRCRRAAVLRAASKGFDYGPVQCLLSKVKEEERVFFMLNRNNGLGFTPLELARGYQKLIEQGFNQTQIAERVGRKSASISQALMVLRADESIHKAISEGKMSFTTAQQICTEHGDQAAEVAAELIAKAEDNGQEKVTAKTTKSLNGTSTRVVPKKAYVQVSDKVSEIIKSLKQQAVDLESKSDFALAGQSISVDAQLLKRLLEAHTELESAKAAVSPVEKKNDDEPTELNMEIDFGQDHKRKAA